MNYTGALYGRIGRKYVPLNCTSARVDYLERLEAQVRELASVTDRSNCDLDTNGIWSAIDESLKELEQC